MPAVVATPPPVITCRPVRIPAGDVVLEGELQIPEQAFGIVIVANGRHSPRNQIMAEAVCGAGMATLLIDLLSSSEKRRDSTTAMWSSDIEMLALRLMEATRWLESLRETQKLAVGYCAADAAGVVALAASAAGLGNRVAAVVAWGSSPDLAGTTLLEVKSPTLLIVGGYDQAAMFLNEEAYAKLRCVKDFRIVPGATHLFQEPGKLEQVARFGVNWFSRHLRNSGQRNDSE